MPCNAVDYDCLEVEAQCAQMDRDGIPCSSCPYYVTNQENQDRVTTALKREADNVNLDDIPF